MKVDVYKNLHKGCMSIRSRERTNYGRVVSHSKHIELRDCNFVVNPKGRERVIREKRKNVHAFIRGKLVGNNPLSEFYGFFSQTFGSVPLDGWTQVTYNPYRSETFVEKDWNEDYATPVFYAKEVMIIDNKVYAMGILNSPNGV